MEKQVGQYWFKARKYGWGILGPITWQGWVAFLCFIILIQIIAYVDNMFGADSLSLKNSLRFIAHVIILALLFLLIFRKKVEGGLKWHWGERKE